LIRPALRALALVAALGLGTVAHAQGVPVTVGAFTASKTCTTYVLQWGRVAASSESGSAGYVNGYGAGYVSGSSSSYAAEWGAELRRECEQHFSNLRSTVASALASSDALRRSGRHLILTGRLTNVGYDTSSVGTQGSTVGNQSIVVTIEFQLKDAGGRLVYGGAITKHFPIEDTTDTASVSYHRQLSGAAGFTQTQREAAYAVARAVVFHFDPLRVTANDGTRVALNYGTPLVPLGSAIMVSQQGSLGAFRLNVSSATGSEATAESDGGVSVRGVPIGSIVTFVEADDAQAGSNLLQHGTIPEN
jgi:hypothetical protein